MDPEAKKKSIEVIVISDDDDDDSISGDSSTSDSTRTDTGSDGSSTQRDSPVTTSDSDNDESAITPGTEVTDNEASECEESSTPAERRPLCNIPGCFLKDITSPASIYITHFQEKKQELVTRLYKLYNQTVFKNQLPENLQITWSKSLTAAAGKCTKGKAGAERYSIIELSDKVCDSADRVRDTLVHEMCHAACWLIDGVLLDGHGPVWMVHGQRVTRVHPELPPVTTYHSFDIHYKFIYQCSLCQHRYGSFQNIAADKAYCRLCGGKLHLVTTG